MSSLLVIGLGNPGEEYAKTRHNVGAATIELIAKQLSLSLSTQKATKARVAVTTISGERVIFAVPMTYMNDSGKAAALLARHYLADEEEPLRQLIVIHDELDLDAGVVRLKFGGGTAGHNGLKSLGAHLHGFDFGRLRIGVGRPPGQMSGADYVLRRLTKSDAEVLDLACHRATEAVSAVIADGFDRAMNVFNTR
jgi:PTH1 family peptidyl-tRNA hydrolase